MAVVADSGDGPRATWGCMGAHCMNVAATSLILVRPPVRLEGSEHICEGGSRLATGTVFHQAIRQKLVEVTNCLFISARLCLLLFQRHLETPFSAHYSYFFFAASLVLNVHRAVPPFMFLRSRRASAFIIHTTTIAVDMRFFKFQPTSKSHNSEDGVICRCLMSLLTPLFSYMERRLSPMTPTSSPGRSFEYVF